MQSIQYAGRREYRLTDRPKNRTTIRSQDWRTDKQKDRHEEQKIERQTHRQKRRNCSDCKRHTYRAEDKKTNIQSRKHNSRKSVKWSAVPVPCLNRLFLELEVKQCSRPNGLSHMRPKFQPWGIWAQRVGIGPRGRDLGYKVGIWALRLGFGPWLGFGPKGWDLVLQTGI